MTPILLSVAASKFLISPRVTITFFTVSHLCIVPQSCFDRPLHVSCIWFRNTSLAFSSSFSQEPHSLQQKFLRLSKIPFFNSKFSHFCYFVWFCMSGNSQIQLMNMDCSGLHISVFTFCCTLYNFIKQHVCSQLLGVRQTKTVLKGFSSGWL